MTQQTAEPGGFLPPHSLPSGPPKHARFGSCCDQQSRPMAALMWPVAGKMLSPSAIGLCGWYRAARLCSDDSCHCPLPAWGRALLQNTPWRKDKAQCLCPPGTLVPRKTVAPPYLPVFSVDGGPLLAVGPVRRAGGAATGHPYHHPPAITPLLPPHTVMSPSR